MSGLTSEACRLVLIVLTLSQDQVGILAHTVIKLRAGSPHAGLSHIVWRNITDDFDEYMCNPYYRRLQGKPWYCHHCFPPDVCIGTTSAGGIASLSAEAACLSVYNNAEGLMVTQALLSVRLGEMTLGPGVYSFPASAATLSSALTLDGSTDALREIIFQIATSFGTVVGSEVALVNGRQAGNVYF